MLLEGVREIWIEYPKGGSGGGGKGNGVPKERMIPKMFLRGDSVIIVMANPAGAARSSKSDEEGVTKMEES